jgi:acylphosphatase
MSSDLARQYVVHGRVQGVGFRYFVERMAGELGCRGYVRNRANGTVEVYAMGSFSKLQRLGEKLRQGPSLARVDQVEELEAVPEPVEGFQVRY